MKMFTTLTAVAGLCILVTYSSCTSGGGGFTSKEDSLRFAKAYFNKYPGENSVKVKYNSADSILERGFGPLPWSLVVQYQKSYDQNPLIYSPEGVALQGYQIDTAGYNMLRNNKSIKGLYLRLGKKADSAITILVLGTDAKGNVINGSNAVGGEEGDGGNNDNGTYDNTAPCPKNCPPNDPE